MAHRITTTITAVTRGSSSKSGNPRWNVITTDGAWMTVADGAVGYGIGNSEYRGAAVVTIDNIQIVGVSTVDGQQFTGRQQ